MPNARTKDRLEDELHRLVCAGKLDIRDAQQPIRGTGAMRMQNMWEACREAIRDYSGYCVCDGIRIRDNTGGVLLNLCRFLV